MEKLSYSTFSFVMLRLTILRHEQDKNARWSSTFAMTERYIWISDIMKMLRADEIPDYVLSQEYDATIDTLLKL